MSTPLSPDGQGSSTRPYLIRALHDWCTDNGFTPYLAVYVDASVQVPAEYVKNNEIVLNVGFEATSGLKLGNDFIEFRARFGGMARDILVPVDHVVAIYARENGQGMAFPMPTGESEATVSDGGGGTVSHSTAPASEGGPRGLRLAPSTASSDDAGAPGADDDDTPPEAPTPAPTSPRPALKRIK